jgi:diguanylate cyclase (GGDEF)-like protein
MISKDGTKYYLQDRGAPIFDDTGKSVGVVIVFRDVTEAKKQHAKIEYLSFHDELTGLYNRRFFETEMGRIDTKRNLPLCIIVGDVNGLKLTNDVFGHMYGDFVLKSTAEIIRNNCRSDDIIARWGGDEFVILLPKTSMQEAKKIISRIKKDFESESIEAI